MQDNLQLQAGVQQKIDDMKKTGFQKKRQGTSVPHKVVTNLKHNIIRDVEGYSKSD